MSTVVYRGYGPHDNPAGGRLVTVTRDGIESPLRHVVRHSPTGLSWGYAGSGPADLARSLLIDALGHQARCPCCQGNGKIALRMDALGDEPDIVPFNGDIHGWDADEQHPRRFDVQRCWDCEQGILALPYQQLKREFVATWPEAGWTITQADVLAWHATVAPSEP
jgi:hypothetical protein